MLPINITQEIPIPIPSIDTASYLFPTDSTNDAISNNSIHNGIIYIQTKMKIKGVNVVLKNSVSVNHKFSLDVMPIIVNLRSIIEKNGNTTIHANIKTRENLILSQSEGE
jgi:hypothetical protein